MAKQAKANNYCKQKGSIWLALLVSLMALF